MRKIFFWDAIFTLDLAWMNEFADAYATEIGLPFECYTHPHAMSRPMAEALARAGFVTRGAVEREFPARGGMRRLFRHVYELAPRR